MKICLLSCSDSRGGAYAATYRLHQGLVQAGADSTMIVSEKTRADPTVLGGETKQAKALAKIIPILNSLPLKLYPDREPTNYSLQWLPDPLASKVTHLAPDIINLHFVTGGYLKIETLPHFHKPLVWTLHDMWAFTGGCHYSQECDRYTSCCGACPILHSTSNWDVSRWVWQRKAKAWENLNLTIVTPSNWLAELARASSLFKNLRIEVIANGLDTKKYKPMEREIARSRLNLPPDKKLVLFGSGNINDRRKGMNLLESALKNLSQSGWGDKLELVIFGSSPASKPSDLGFKTHYLGRLKDDISLAIVYAAADVFAAPSIQDNLPNTVMEAIACGTPCVAFDIGGIPDMIEHQQNGYLAQAFKIEDLARGIIWVLEDSDRHQKLSARAHEKALQNFTVEIQAARYLSLFEEILKKSAHPIL